jgi:hypothetical protein
MLDIIGAKIAIDIRRVERFQNLVIDGSDEG